MKTLIVTLVLGALIAIVGPSSAAQQEGHQMPGMVMDPCRDQSQQAIAVIDAASQRLELARQTNSPSDMRAAIDALQSALGQIKSQLGPCAAPIAPGSAAANSMPGMVHAMPGVPQAATATGPVTSGGAAASRDLDITLTSRPDPPKLGDNQFEVTVKRSNGEPVVDAQVSLLFVMPAMPQMKMPEMRNQVQLTSAGNGKYTGSASVMMAGSWNLKVSIKQAGKEIAQKTLTLTAR